MQLELYEHKLKEDKEYSATQLSDILKWIDKPFKALNDTEKEKDRRWFCDFKPRKKIHLQWQVAIHKEKTRTV